MSWLNTGSGGALVPPPKQGKRVKLQSALSRRKYLVKAQGTPCEPGERADVTGCIPVSGETTGQPQQGLPQQTQQPQSSADIASQMKPGAAKILQKQAVKILSKIGSKLTPIKTAYEKAKGWMGKKAEKYPKVAKGFAKMYQAGRWLEHKAMIAFHKARELAIEQMKERGVSAERAELVAKIICGIDLASSWTLTMPGAYMLTGNPIVAKASAYLPIATLIWVAGTSVLSVPATYRAAKKVLQQTLKGGEQEGHKGFGHYYRKAHKDGNKKAEFAGDLGERIAKSKDPEWYACLFSIAYDEVKNPHEAMRMADDAIVKHPTDPNKQSGDLREKSLFLRYRRKDMTVGTCEQGERSDLTGCTPASGKPSQSKPKPTKVDQDKPKAKPPGSQMEEGVKKRLRDYGMVGTFPPADVPLSDIKIADLSKDVESLRFEPLMSWSQKTKSGRISRQYRYTQEFHDRNANEKFDRVSAIEPYIEQIEKGLIDRMSDSSLSDKEREAAAIASVIRETGLRPTDGEDSIKHGHFGISSIQARHAKIKGNEIHLDFIGKEGVRNRTVIRNPDNVRFLTDALSKISGKDFVFQKANSGDAGDLLKSISKGVGGPEDIKVKDLRTLKATQTAKLVVNKFKGPPPPLTGSKAKDAKAIAKAILSMSADVAKVLNNTPTQARDNYIHPEVFRQWQLKLQKAS